MQLKGEYHAAEDGTRNYMILNERVPIQTAKLPFPEWKRANLPVIGLPYREVTSFLATVKTKASFRGYRLHCWTLLQAASAFMSSSCKTRMRSLSVSRRRIDRPSSVWPAFSRAVIFASAEAAEVAQAR